MRASIPGFLKMRLAFVSAAVMASMFVSPALAEEQAKPADDPNKMICKRDAEVGSLIKRRKTCMTRAEWDKFAESQQRGSQRMVEELRSKSGGN